MNARRAQRARPRMFIADDGPAMTDTASARPRIVIDCIYYAVAIWFFLYVFYYYWTGVGGATLLALTLIPITFVLFTLQALRDDDLYPRLPPLRELRHRGDLHRDCSCSVSYYMNTEYEALGTSRAGMWDPADLIVGRRA